MMETQEYQSQNESEYHSTLEEHESSYALLKSLYRHKSNTSIVDIRNDFQTFGFGRENDPEYTEFMTFERDDFVNRNSFNHISKVHFYLNRFVPYDDHKCFKQLPIVINVLGRNGLYVNEKKLTVGEKLLLRDGDTIKLSRNTPLFRFSYRNTTLNLANCTELENNYFVGDTIGSGGNGSVYVTYEINPNEEGTFSTYALKNIRKRNVTGLANIDNFNQKLMREVDIMRRLNNPHVLELVDFFDTPDNLVILLPIMFGGDLLHRIQRSGRLSERDAKFFFLQLLLGLRYMHKKGIAHRDIKCDNLLLSDHGTSPLLKISDFGLSKILQNNNTVCGTKFYASPEIINNVVDYTVKVDIWSAGVVLYAMLSGTFPFHQDNREETVDDQIRKGKFCFPKRNFNHTSEMSKYIIRLMLQVNPKNRWDIDLLLRHCWLRDSENNCRLEKTIEIFYGPDYDDDTLTGELENVAIAENGATDPNVHLSKRPRLG